MVTAVSNKSPALHPHNQAGYHDIGYHGCNPTEEYPGMVRVEPGAELLMMDEDSDEAMSEGNECGEEYLAELVAKEQGDLGQLHHANHLHHHQTTTTANTMDTTAVLSMENRSRCRFGC